MTDQATPMPDSLERRAARRLEQAFQNESLAGMKLALQVRITALLAVGLLLLFLTISPWLYYYEASVLLVALNGIITYRLCRRALAQRWIVFLSVAFDFAIVTLAMIAPIALIDEPWPPQLFLRSGTFVYFFLFLALAALTYAPVLMLWAGLTGALCWAMGVAWIFSQPGTVTIWGFDSFQDFDALIELVLNSRYVALDVVMQDIAVYLIVAGILAAVVWRSRQLVGRQMMAERERANLSRYFPPTIVDELSRSDEPLTTVRAQKVAVLFADLVGFTRLAEQSDPKRVVDILRAFHARLERAVFDHEGTLDKFLGDGLMATFGTPMAGPRDGINALACAQAMRDSIAAWNRERSQAGDVPLRLSIGIHYGEVVLGDIGTERRLEWAVLGDVVNVASRLEGLTRELGCDLVVSEALVREARSEAPEEAEDLLTGFALGAPQPIRGREEPVKIWCFGTRPT